MRRPNDGISGTHGTCNGSLCCRNATGTLGRVYAHTEIQIKTVLLVAAYEQECHDYQQCAEADGDVAWYREEKT